MPKFLLVTFFFLTSIAAKAQTWEIGASIGGAGYMGDLNTHNPLKVSGLSAGGFIKRNFNGYLSLKGSFQYGKISAADSNSNNQQFRDRNLSFNNKLLETSLTGEFNFMHYIPDAGKNRFTPFIFLGVGITAHAPRTIFEGQNVGLRDHRTEGQTNKYPKSIIAIPYGAGIKYNVGGKWTLIGDLGYRYTNTDYLDDVSGAYPGKSVLPNDLSKLLSDRSGEIPGKSYIGEIGMQRGDLRKRDTYLFLNLSISYTFVTQRCYYENQ
ncbi:MAG: hypothetical protein EOP47_23655 [Sphingobacteriaceae bacterium]|nr:MAG: hypothetical protein EOP47_23655 [Sphingobacteriaceae bacterium]